MLFGPGLLVVLLLFSLCSLAQGSLPPPQPPLPPHQNQDAPSQILANLVAQLRNAIISRNVAQVKDSLQAMEDFGKQHHHALSLQGEAPCPTCPPAVLKKSSKTLTTSTSTSQEVERKRMIALFNECSEDLRHARLVLDTSKRHQEKEVEKLRQVQAGVIQLMNSLRLTQVDLMQAQRETSEREQELSLFHEQAATAAKIERDIAEIQRYARVNYETGEMELAREAADSPLNLDELSRSHKFLATRLLPVDAAIMHGNPTLLLDFVSLLAASTLGGALARALAAKTVPFPHIVGFLLAGALVGPNGFALVHAVVEVDTLAQFGGIFVLFAHGLEFSPQEQRKFRAMSVGGTLLAAAMTAVVIQLLTLVVSGIVSTPLEGLLLGMSVSLSSLSVVIDYLRLHKLLQSTPAKVMIGMLGFQGFLVGILFSIPRALAVSEEEEGELATFDAFLAMFVLVMYALATAAFAMVISRYVLPRFWLPGMPIELYLLCAVSLCMLFALLTSSLGLSMELGAFFAGLILSELDAGSRRTKELVLPLSTVFGSMLFASLGMMLNLEFFWKNLVEICLIALQLVVIKLGVIWAVARLFDLSFRTAIFCAVGLCHVGELSLVFSSKLLGFGLLSRRAYLLFLAATCVTLTTAPLVMRILANKRVTELINKWDDNRNGIVPASSTGLESEAIILEPEQQQQQHVSGGGGAGDFTSAWRRKT